VGVGHYGEVRAIVIHAHDAPGLPAQLGRLPKGDAGPDEKRQAISPLKENWLSGLGSSLSRRAPELLIGYQDRSVRRQRMLRAHLWVRTGIARREMQPSHEAPPGHGA
jgi:hypothetical protein